jgi:hypothetical protein
MYLRMGCHSHILAGLVAAYDEWYDQGIRRPDTCVSCPSSPPVDSFHEITTFKRFGGMVKWEPDLDTSISRPSCPPIHSLHELQYSNILGGMVKCKAAGLEHNRMFFATRETINTLLLINVPSNPYPQDSKGGGLVFPGVLAHKHGWRATFKSISKIGVALFSL